MTLWRKSGFHPQPFRFEGMWTLDRSSTEVIRQAWNSIVSGSPLLQVVRCVKSIEVAMKRWNKRVFGRVHENIKDLRDRIAVLQDSSPSDLLMNKERELQVQLDNLLKKEEFLWKEKSKEKWMEDGDLNTKLFHLATVIRRRSNHIASIQHVGHLVATDHDSIRGVFMDYFLTLFSSAAPECPSELHSIFPHSLSTQDCMGLEDIPSGEEIKAVVFSMSNGKSLGMDGLSPLFFKFYWDIV